jgi:transposase
VDDRRVISGIVHVLRSGGRWVDAPVIYGPGKTLYNRFVRWAAKGVWQAAFEALAAAGGPPAEVLLDSTHVKAHRCAAGGKGGSGSKRSASAVADVPPRSTP